MLAGKVVFRVFENNDIVVDLFDLVLIKNPVAFEVPDGFGEFVLCEKTLPVQKAHPKKEDDQGQVIPILEGRGQLPMKLTEKFRQHGLIFFSRRK